MISGEDLEEVWEKAITVARVELPNRSGLKQQGGVKGLVCRGTRRLALTLQHYFALLP